MNTANQQTTDLLRDLEDVFNQHDPFRVRYEPNELICQAGSYAAGVYLVTEGIVRETYVDALTGRGEVWMGLLGSGELIGSEFSQPDDNRLHRTSCRAVSTTSLLFLERHAFETAVEKHEVLRWFLFAYLVERSFNLVRALWRLQVGPEERVCSLLLDLARLGEQTPEGRIAMPEAVDLQLLAGLLRLSPWQTRRAYESLAGVGRIGDRLTFAPEELLSWQSERKAVSQA
jgi:CRP-like cAMP-binding protein